jgi:hypothetical protein
MNHYLKSHRGQRFSFLGLDSMYHAYAIMRLQAAIVFRLRASVVKKNAQIGLGVVSHTCTAKLRSHPYRMLGCSVPRRYGYGGHTARLYIRKIRGMWKVGRCIIDIVLDTTVSTYKAGDNYFGS